MGILFSVLELFMVTMLFLTINVFYIVFEEPLSAVNEAI